MDLELVKFSLDIREAPRTVFPVQLMYVQVGSGKVMHTETIQGFGTTCVPIREEWGQVFTVSIDIDGNMIVGDVIG